MKTLNQLQREIVEWSHATFGWRNTVDGKINHLRKEVEELAAAPRDEMEMADIVILLLYIANHAGKSGDDLLEAVERKLELVKRRQWGVPDADGCCQHIEEGQS
jgi:NTP pyrophosphatase (non-canonical NTP hydrolase)